MLPLNSFNLRKSRETLVAQRGCESQFKKIYFLLWEIIAMILSDDYVPGQKKELMIQERKEKQQTTNGVQC